MSGLTVSCPVTAIGSLVNKKDAYSNIYKELTKVLKEDDILGIQLYPAGWPRKLQMTLVNNDIKNRILVKGLDILGLHVEFRDEDNIVTKIVIKDAPMEWSDEFIIETMESYGEVVRTEKEMVYVDGRRTSWTTGTRFVYLSKIYDDIPSKLEVKIGIKVFTLSAWYRGQGGVQAEPKACTRCGSSLHSAKTCPHEVKVCFTCKKPDHSNKECPQNDGTRKSDETMIFFNAKCPLNNRNSEYPFSVNDLKYLSVEQYVTHQKCLLFGDTHAATRVMQETHPRAIRDIGENLRNYDHRVWMGACRDILHKGVLAKFSNTESVGATSYLMETGDLLIGEATRNSKWGTGLHISDQNALNHLEWKGENWMGVTLMNVRAIIRAVQEPNTNDQNAEVRNDSFVIEIDQNDDASIEAPPKQWAVVIGDSNVVGLSFDDDSVPLSTLSCAKGGTKLDDVPDRIKECKLQSKEVDIVALTPW